MDNLTNLLRLPNPGTISLPQVQAPANLFDILSVLVIAILFWPLLVNLLLAILTASSWIFWIVTSLLFGTVQFGYIVYQFFRISIDVSALITLKTIATLRNQVLYYGFSLGVVRRKKRNRKREWRHRLKEANCFDDFCKIGIEEASVSNGDEQEKKKLDNNEMLESCSSIDSDLSSVESDSTNSSPSSPPTSISKSKSCVDFHHTSSSSSSSSSTTATRPPMRRARSQIDVESLFSSSNTSDTTERLHHTTSLLCDARAEFPSNPSPLSFLLSAVVKRNHLGVDDALIDDARHVSEKGIHSLPPATRQTLVRYVDEVEHCLSVLDSPAEHLPLLVKLKQNTGCTALMLSGGGAQAMNHLGIVRALVEGGVYERIPVISGTSGGSAVAGMCAIATPEELLRDVCVPTLSTDYKGTGEMAREGIRWSPTIVDMGLNWFRTGLLFESKEFKRLNDFYFGDTTFEEAFQKTKKHVCISVSASRAGRGGVQRLLLNHISTPHVTIASAVAASCALPGVMTPAKLQAKKDDGTIVPFEVDGTEWIDGSVQADIPFQRISTLFNVSNYIVCQVNFHVVPFLHKPHHPSLKSAYWRLFQLFEWDIRNRALNLGRLGLFPKLFGQDVSKMFKQKYHGNLTIVPQFTKMQVFGLKVLINPTVADMEVYIRNGEVATWPYVRVIDQILRLETAIEKSLNRLQNKLQSVDHQPNDCNPPQANIDTKNQLYDQMKVVEAENKFLRDRVEWLERELKECQKRAKDEDAAADGVILTSPLKQ